jgi:poly(glycerol-phosphate) alpha-glucosyltransferase
MAHRLPCLLSPACNLPEAYDRGAATAVEPEATALGGALRQLLQQPAAELAAMGDAGRQLVAERFSWQQVAERTAGLYGWLHGAGERPDWIEVPAERPAPVPGW